MNNKSWATTRERGSAVGMKIVLFVMSTFGYVVASLFLYPIVFYFYLTGRGSRNASLLYLKKVHLFGGTVPKPTFFSGYFHFISFAKSAMDKLWFWQSKLSRFTFHLVGLDKISAFLDSGKGCLLLGAHVGNIESLRALCLDRDVKVNAVMYLDNARQYNSLLRSINPNSQLRIINLKDRSIDGVMELKACIDNGEIVALLADRFHPSSRSRVVSCSFLGEEAPFPANPWIVAGLLKCPTFFVAGMKTGPRQYESIVHFVDEQVRIERKHREADLKKYIRQYAAFLEGLCCKYPYQWYNFFDFWRFDEQREVSEN